MTGKTKPAAEDLDAKAAEQAARQKALEDREAELADREAALAGREAGLKAAQAGAQSGAVAARGEYLAATVPVRILKSFGRYVVGDETRIPRARLEELLEAKTVQKLPEPGGV